MTAAAVLDRLDRDGILRVLPLVEPDPGCPGCHGSGVLAGVTLCTCAAYCADHGADMAPCPCLDTLDETDLVAAYSTEGLAR